MFRSITAVLLGVAIAIFIVMLLVFGIAAPVLSRFFPPSLMHTSALPAAIFIFSYAFAMYFGGMAASYRAAFRRQAHGVFVAVLLFVVSPALNLAAHKDPFPQLHNTGYAIMTAVLFVVSVIASYIGGRRGESLYYYNQKVSRQRQARQKRSRRSSG